MRGRWVWGLSALVVATGCGGASYEPGAFTEYGRFDEPRLRGLDCVDVLLQPRGEGTVGRLWVAIDFEVGNRCTSPEELDFSAIAVFGETSSRPMTPMPLYDPKEEVVLATLDGRRSAHEALAYQPPAGAGELSRVCVDVSGLAEGEPVSPVCFRRSGDSMRVEVAR